MNGTGPTRLQQTLVFAVKSTNPLVWEFKRFDTYYEQFLAARAEFQAVTDKFMECLGDYDAESIYQLLCLIVCPVQRVYCLVLLANAYRERYNSAELFFRAFQFFAELQDSVQQFFVRLYSSELINRDLRLVQLIADNFRLLLDNYAEIELPNAENYAFLVQESSWHAETLLVRSSAQYITKKYEARLVIMQWLKICLFCDGREFLNEWHVIKELLIEQLAVEPPKNRYVFVELFVKLLAEFEGIQQSNTAVCDLGGLITQFNEQLLCKTTSKIIFELYGQIMKSSPPELKNTIVKHVVNPLFEEIILELKTDEIVDSFELISFLLLVLDYAEGEFLQEFIHTQLGRLFDLLRACDQRNAEIFFTKLSSLLNSKDLKLTNEFVIEYLSWANILVSRDDFMYNETIFDICRLLTRLKLDEGVTDAVLELQNSNVAYTFLLGLSTDLMKSQFAAFRELLTEQQRVNLLLSAGIYDEEMEYWLINQKFEALRSFLAEEKYEVAKKLYADLETEVATARDRADLELIKLFYGKANVEQLIKEVSGAVCEFEILCEIAYWQKSNGQSVDEQILDTLPEILANYGDSKVAYANLAHYLLRG